jgi:peptidoglycan/LPS O-acetylase OafA/YrhL
MSASGFRADLQGLRGLAVAMVVAFHLQAKGLGGGFVGVDVFFVLSGFLMTRIVVDGLAGDGFHYGRFLLARAARIWPALAVLVLGLFVAGAWRLPPFDLQALAAQALRALSFTSNHHYLAHSGYITAVGDTQWLLHTWSLSVEWQFYLLYPLLLLAVWRIAPATRRMRALRAAVAVVALASLGAHLWLAREGADAGFFLLAPRAWEMLAGGLVVLCPLPAPVPVRWRTAMSLAGVVLLLLSLPVLAAVRLRPVGSGAWLLLPVAATLLVLWADTPRNVLLGLAPLQRLGTWSYSVYLWHWPLVIAARMTDYPLAHPLSTALLIVVASLMLGWASYTWVERPGIGLRHASIWRSARQPLVTMLLAGAATGGVAMTQGLAFRAGAGDGFYPGYAAAIQPLLYPEPCSNYKKRVQDMRTCGVDRGAPARVLVIGDSHGEHLYPWFVAHSARSVDVFTASECPPVPNFERLQPGYHCRDYAQVAWDRARSAAYELVVVSARWPTAGLAGAPYCHQAPDGPCAEPRSLSAKQALILHELQAAVASLLAAGKTVVMVDGAPEARQRTAERLAREQFWYGEARLSVPRASLEAQTGWLEPLFKAFEGRPGFHRVSVRPRLCDASRCRLFDPTLKRPVLFDESHFDPVWIAAQAELFAPFVATR